MKNAATWIVITLVLIAAFVGLVLWLGTYGYIIGGVLFVLFLFGLDRFYRRKAQDLTKSITIGESLVARGFVSESTYDQAAAILVHQGADRYRIHATDSRGSQAVRSVGAELKSHRTNPYDVKKYIEICTDQGPVHFAPVQGATVFGQPAYAQQVLAGLLANGVPRTA